ncbi:F-box/LRR-repeat protein [Cardamine amara subsp. amara]|uniref:F-box/LRR-repeat protein n=1 Tax=Cardamine amara subsp. amara TaxID=228776 RepID=A0ABD0ZWX0_CARAN
MDRVSSLPDEVLGHMLSFLSTKEAASTSVLSKRNFMDFVESLLSLQGNSPIKKFALKSNLGDGLGNVDPNRVQRWICDVLKRGVVDLDVFITFRGNSSPLPSMIFKSNTLVKLRLGRGFTIQLSDDVFLPMLKTLSLESAYVDGDHDAIEILLPRCPVLEELVVEEKRWVHWCGSVSSPSLKRLCIRSFNIPIISVDVPNLVYLELSCIFGSKYANVNLDSLVEARLNLWVEETRIKELRNGSVHLNPDDMLDLINGIRHVRVLHLSSDALELLYFSCQELPMFDNLVHLSIESDMKRGWQILPLLIKNSPNLETLIFKGLKHYKTKNCGDVCVCYQYKNIPSCLSSSRVKVLEISGYQGKKRELNQMKHFLKKLSCLELVKIRPEEKGNNLQVTIDMFLGASSKWKIQVM